MEKKFCGLGVSQDHPLWQDLTRRQFPLYERESPLREQFYRDYTRILHSSAFRRLKHKTQVFPHVESDHICTRMEHVLHVESVSTTISETLGLSVPLTRAIALGHDLGHSPFGHAGEKVLSEICKRELGEPFWHEKNGLYFADCIELLDSPDRVKHNLSLTYAVRDGILCHCGELDENGLRPRTDLLDPLTLSHPGEHNSITWEGCVVKLSDKIAYLGRDIEDADTLGLLDSEGREALREVEREFGGSTLNTTGIIHAMVSDVCQNSDPEKGICLSPAAAALMDKTKELNYRYIYTHKRFRPFTQYAKMVMESVYTALKDAYTGIPYLAVSQRDKELYPTLMGGFAEFVFPYTDAPKEGYANTPLYGDLTDPRLYCRAIIDYIAGMTDAYLIRAYEELIRF